MKIIIISKANNKFEDIYDKEFWENLYKNSDSNFETDNPNYQNLKILNENHLLKGEYLNKLKMIVSGINDNENHLYYRTNHDIIDFIEDQDEYMSHASYTIINGCTLKIIEIPDIVENNFSIKTMMKYYKTNIDTLYDTLVMSGDPDYYYEEVSFDMNIIKNFETIKTRFLNMIDMIQTVINDKATDNNDKLEYIQNICNIPNEDDRKIVDTVINNNIKFLPRYSEEYKKSKEHFENTTR